MRSSVLRMGKSGFMLDEALRELLSTRMGIYSHTFESLDDYGKATAGSGSVAWTGDNLKLATGTTADSLAYVEKIGVTGYFPCGPYLFDYNLIGVFNIRLIGADAGAKGYIVVGDVYNFYRYAGFYFEAGKLYGVTKQSGVAENRVDLGVSIPSDIIFRLVVRFLRTICEFYVNEVKRGESRASLPTGTSNWGRMFSARIENPATPVSKELRVGSYTLIVWR